MMLRPLRHFVAHPSSTANLAAALSLWILSGCSSVSLAPKPPPATPPATSASIVSTKPAPVPPPVAPSENSAAIAAAITSSLAVPEALQPTDPLRPGIDPSIEPNSRADLWDRLRRGFVIPDLDNDLVRKGEQWYASRPGYVDRMTQRGSRYLFHILEEVERRNMPTELALLPFIESAFNPQAMSSAKASGMWQFMPATGKDYDLKQNLFRDDRRDVLASTRAALDYLQRLYGMFGDWQLALAAYNWGEGNVQRAVNRNRGAGLPTDYGNLRMPNETQYYVPKLQAVKNIVLDPQAFGLSLPPLENHPYFLSVPIHRDMDVEMAAKLAQMPLDTFKALNPQMNKPVILAAGTSQILLPYDNANLFARNLTKHEGAIATWTAWVAPKTIKPADAARQWNISEATLRDVNRIPPKMLIKAGSTLLVPRHARHTDVAEHIADNAMIALAPEAPPLQRVVFTAKHKDTLTSIAQRYHLVPSQVAEWNKLSISSPLKTGQRVVVYLPRGKAIGKMAQSHASERPRRGASSTTTSARPQTSQRAARATPAGRVRLARTSR